MNTKAIDKARAWLRGDIDTDPMQLVRELVAERGEDSPPVPCMFPDCYDDGTACKRNCLAARNVAGTAPVAEAAAGLNWKPFETAPKDGSRVLLLVEGGIIRSANFKEKDGHWFYAECASDGCGCCMGWADDDTLTHWAEHPATGGLRDGD